MVWLFVCPVVEKLAAGFFIFVTFKSMYMTPMMYVIFYLCSALGAVAFVYKVGEKMSMSEKLAWIFTPGINGIAAVVGFFTKKGSKMETFWTGRGGQTPTFPYPP